jgi:hypothetical protein
MSNDMVNMAMITELKGARTLLKSQTIPIHESSQDFDVGYRPKWPE